MLPAEGEVYPVTSLWRGMASTCLLHQVTMITEKVPPLTREFTATTGRYTPMKNQGEGKAPNIAPVWYLKSSMYWLRICHQIREDHSGAVQVNRSALAPAHHPPPRPPQVDEVMMPGQTMRERAQKPPVPPLHPQLSLCG